MKNNDEDKIDKIKQKQFVDQIVKKVKIDIEYEFGDNYDPTVTERDSFIDKCIKNPPSIVPKGYNLEKLRQEIIAKTEEWFIRDDFYEPPKILSDLNDHEDWYFSRKDEIDWDHWPRYKTKILEDQMGLSKAVIKEIDKVTDSVLDLIEDPKRDGKWDRRGAICGDIQSGKTATFIALIAKAFDAGYKRVIVFSGLHGGLRNQTQLRIEEGLVGYSTKNDKKEEIGVGVTKKSPIQPLTSFGKDFSANLSNSVPMGVQNLEKLIGVAKKNKSVITHLLKYFGKQEGGLLKKPIKQKRDELHNLRKKIQEEGGDFKTNPSYIKLDEELKTLERKYPFRWLPNDIPTLIIDDECDQASINTSKPSEDAKAINRLIRSALTISSKIAYVGFTATPFANIYIPPTVGETTGTSQEEFYGPDLFPSSFIINLPSPETYIGAREIFGLPESHIDTSKDINRRSYTDIVIRLFDHAKTTDLGETIGWMPPRHNMNHEPKYLDGYNFKCREEDPKELLVKQLAELKSRGKEVIPPSLEEAIRWFILASSVRKYRSNIGTLNNSMLIHVSRHPDVQEKVQKQVKFFINKLTDSLLYDEDEEELNLLEKLWDQKFSLQLESIMKKQKKPNPLITWQDIKPIVKNYFNRTEPIEVIRLSGDSKDSLIYKERNERNKDYTVIVIGGNILSRGLTLEGLTVSYYLRTSKTYDALLQMGRWFGHKEKYIDVCRVYLTDQVANLFKVVAFALLDLRDQFDLMTQNKQSPKEFGLRVAQHHDNIIKITSPAKMRSGETLLQEPVGLTQCRFYDIRQNESNLSTVKKLLSSINKYGKQPELSESSGRASSAYLWRDIKPKVVLDFLNNYQQPFKFNTVLDQSYPEAQAKFIEKMVSKNELTSWNICIFHRQEINITLNEIGYPKVNALMRQARINGEKTNNLDFYEFDLKALVSFGDSTVDFDQEQYERALALTKKDNKTSIKPNNQAICKVRPPESGLLMIYPFVPQIDNKKNKGQICYGFAISYPSSRNSEPIKWKINKVLADALKRDEDPEHYSEDDVLNEEDSS